MPRRLDLSDKAVELMAFLSIHSGGAEDVRRALWPSESPERAAELMHDTVVEVNRVVARATGNLTPVIASPGAEPAPLGARPEPRILVHVLAEPFVEVYDQEEPFPGE